MGIDQQKNLFIGIDVGGTNIKAGIADFDGNLGDTASIKTAQTQEKILEQICQLADNMLKTHPQKQYIRGIGVAVPGGVDVEKGVAISATNLPWNNLPITAALTERFGLPATLEKDTDAGALGEFLFGKARNMRNIVYIAIGTGVGGGLIINGELYRGVGGAGEIGHMVALSDGPVCKCGTRGCLEAIASATALVEAASKNSGIPFKDTAEVFTAAASGNEGAKAAVKYAGEALASALISVSRILAPEIVVIGGGVSKAGPQLLEAIQLGYKAFNPRWDSTPIVFSETADWSGVLGAAAAVAMVVRSED